MKQDAQFIADTAEFIDQYTQYIIKYSECFPQSLADKFSASIIGIVGVIEDEGERSKMQAKAVKPLLQYVLLNIFKD